MERIHARDASISDENFLAESDALIRGGLKLSHMKMIVALEDSSQISAAAAQMNISQPAASRMLGEMESILGVSLCLRLPRGIDLTPYGRSFARRARAILVELRQADREIAELHSGKGGSVHLGSVTAPAINLAVPAIKKIREQFPKIQINIQVDTSTVLAKELLASRLDFAIARIPDDLDPRLFETRVIGLERVALIVRRNHPLMQRRRVGLDDLVHFDWVFQPEGSLLRRTVESIFLSHNAPLPERVLNTTSSLLTMVMVAQSDAIAPVSMEVAEFLSSENGLNGDISILPIDFEITVQPYSLITSRDRQLSPAAQRLFDFILAEVN